MGETKRFCEYWRAKDGTITAELRVPEGYAYRRGLENTEALMRWIVDNLQSWGVTDVRPAA